MDYVSSLPLNLFARHHSIANKKQKTKKKSVEVCNCNRMLLSAPTYDMTKSAKKKSLKQILKIGRGSGWI